MDIRFLGKGFFSVLITLVILTGCGVNSVEQIEQTPVFPTEKNERIFQVEIESKDTLASIAEEYDGEVIAWLPEEGFAIVTGIESQTLAQQNIATETNINAVSSIMGSGSFTSGSFASGSFTSGSFAGGSFAGGVNGTYLTQNDQAWNQVELFDAHLRASQLGQGVKVAVLDTGADHTHRLLKGSFSPEREWRDYVDADYTPDDELGGLNSGHGTAAIGVILQVAPKAKILPIRVLDADGLGDLDDLVSAIMYAIQTDVDIINLSLGTSERSSVLSTVIQHARHQGVYVVAAAGNEGKRYANFPARYSAWNWWGEYVIGVGSIDSQDQRSKFSNYDQGAEFFAPGEAIQTTYPGDLFVNATGTSFATPIMVGGVALLLAERPNARVRSELNGSLYTKVATGGAVSINRLLDTVPFPTAITPR